MKEGKMRMQNFLKVFFIIAVSLISLNNSEAQMFWNQTASFNGTSSSYIAVPNSATVNITGSFSFEAWINPSSLSGSSKGIIAKGGALGTTLRYGIRLGANGRITVSTNGATRLISRVSTPIEANKWTHLAVTYNASTSFFVIYLNGLSDTTSTVAGANPASNTDSLYLGISGSSTPFSGQMDEVRLWNKLVLDDDISDRYASTLSANTGVYNGLVMSMTFQDENSSGADFNTRDMSGTGNDGKAKNITAVNQSNNPYSTIHNNESVKLDGTNSYLAANDSVTLDAVNAITLECWVYPLSTAAATYISKGSAAPVYFLGWDGSKIVAKINNSSVIAFINPSIPSGKWSHLAFVYNSSGSYNLYINGVPQFAGNNPLGNINTNSDSLYIGGGPGALSDFNGYIDEVRITKNHSKSEYEILSNLNNSIDLSNDPSAGQVNISYNFDGMLIDNANNGGTKLRFNGNAKFSHPASIGNTPVSPMTRDENNRLSKGYYIKRIAKNVPTSGSSGATLDTLTINENVIISDVNLFVAINHQNTSQLTIVLTAPNGDSVRVLNGISVTTIDDGLVTVFDDQADSSLFNGRYITLSPAFKPANSLNTAFTGGDRSQGKWRLRITDNAGGSTGILYGWGIQFNNQTETRLNLNVGILIQGFYNAGTELMVRDTMRIYARDSESPYTIIDSSIAYLSNTGLGLFSLKASMLKYKIQLQLKHRNSIETWAGEEGISLNFLDVSYDFFGNPSRAFGENLIQVDPFPLYAIYNGDVNQDNTIDITDMTLIDNDVFSFSSGYLSTDVTGDNLIDLNDYSITDNNAANFVSAVIP
ncbi:MAG: proprotein convertase P-domain-containing protein [Ignavibacteria bacterium]|nr:proprotein convertase P-domain-containing protein [Ignavibacteria bacterium]